MKKNIPWDLVINHLKQVLSKNEEQLFEQWLSVPENKELFQELESVWNKVREEASSYEPDTAFYWKEMQRRMNSKKGNTTRKVSINRIRVVWAAASILFIIALSGTYFAGKQQVFGGKNNMQSYTALSGKSKVMLPDSTIVWLNAGSTIDYSASFLKKRDVKLKGEALFEVSKDKTHPFSVYADNIKVMVHGTRFNVNANEKNEKIEVSLFEGSVSVTAGNFESFLKPGESASFDRKTKKLLINEVDNSIESCWAREKISFEGKSLSDIVPYLERWYNIEIELDPTIPNNQAYTFTIKEEPLEVVLRIMSRINPIYYTFESDNKVRIDKK